MQGKLLGAMLTIQLVLSCNAATAETFEKEGNNGTVSCDIFCGAAKADKTPVWGDKVGYCVEAINKSTGEKFSCDTVPGLMDGLMCTCASDVKIKQGNNGTVTCDTYCAHHQSESYQECVAGWNNVTNDNSDASCTSTPGLLRDGKEMTCTCSSLAKLPSGPVSEVHAKAFAPRVYFADEEYFPSSVEFFIKETKEEEREGEKYLITNEPLGCDSCTNPSFLDGQRPDQTSVPVYAMIVPKSDPKITDIVYWMFYPYNNGKRVCLGLFTPLGCAGGYSTFGNHVGDWEHITVRFKDGIPSEIYLGQHAHGATYRFGDPAVKLVDGRHPVVYAAQGSHGLYADQGRHEYRSLPNGDSLVDYTGQGIAWDTWKNIKVVSWKPQGTYDGEWSWLNYTGRWGNPKSGCTIESVAGECVLNPGPTGPMMKKSSDPNFSGLD